MMDCARTGGSCSFPKPFEEEEGVVDKIAFLMLFFIWTSNGVGDYDRATIAGKSPCEWRRQKFLPELGMFEFFSCCHERVMLIRCAYAHMVRSLFARNRYMSIHMT